MFRFANVRVIRCGPVAGSGRHLCHAGVLSFDVYLQHFASGEPAKADRAAVAAVLRAFEARGPDDRGLCHVPIGDLWTILGLLDGNGGCDDPCRAMEHLRYRR